MFLLYELHVFFSFEANKVWLWPKQKTGKNNKDEATKVGSTTKPLTSAGTCALPKLTESERERQSPFERVIYDMSHNEKICNDLMLGRRVGFYELRGEIGQGNFSTVRLGIHALTKGEIVRCLHLHLKFIASCYF